MTISIKWKTPDCEVGFGVVKDQKGAALLYLIAVILLMATLGAAMLDFTTTSTFGQLTSNHLDRAYYMAEAGGRYILPKAKAKIKSGNDDYSDLNHTFTLADGSFRIEVKKDAAEENLFVHSTGAIQTNLSAPTRVEITYRMKITSIFNKAVSGTGTITIGNNANIIGDVSTSASEILGNGSLNITGEVETNAVTDYEVMELPVADHTTIGDYTEPQNFEKKNNGANENRLTSGTYTYKSVELENKATLRISGDVVLSVKDGFMADNNSTIEIEPESSLILYSGGLVKFVNGASIVFDPADPARPEDFIIYGCQGSSIEFSNVSSVTAVIYAPNAPIVLNQVSYVTGALIGKDITLENNATLEFDDRVINTSLPGEGGGVTLEPPVRYFSSGA